ncbi:MAG: 30S ribosomal protein S16 [Coriobacteriia bacterium]|nr:30S ribosomal protein S16 [Coriobacteriia bacterium]
MSVKIRLARAGAKKTPFYRVVAADSRAPRDGRFIEILGRYNPRTEPSTIELDLEKIDAWIAKGAQTSETVAKLIAIAKDPDAKVPAKAAAPSKKARAKAEAESKAEAEAKTAAEATPEPEPVIEAEEVSEVEAEAAPEEAEAAPEEPVSTDEAPAEEGD